MVKQLRMEASFLGFVAKVHSIDEVIMAYQHVKYRFMDATHIICAYRISDPDFAHHQDCIDGGEHGATCRILQMMIDNAYENTVALVVRYHAGPNIGQICFSMINDVAKTAIQSMPRSFNQLVADTGFSAFKELRAEATHTTIQRSARHTTPRTRRGSTAARQLQYGNTLSQPHPQRTPGKILNGHLDLSATDEQV